MKYFMTILFLATCSVAQAQTPVLTIDLQFANSKLSFVEKGDLKITALATSCSSDSDFLVGKWKMHNRRLNKRLENCKDWTEFEGAPRCGSLIRKPGCGFAGMRETRIARCDPGVLFRQWQNLGMELV